MTPLTGVPYWRLSGYYFFFFMVIGGLLPYWPLYLKQLGFSITEIGILSTILIITKIFSAFLWGWVMDKTQKTVEIVHLTSLATWLLFALVLWFQDFWSLVIILFSFSVFWSAGLPLIEAATMSHLEQDTHYYTTIRIWGSIGFIFSVIGLGYGFNYYSYHYLPIILLVMMIFVWLHSLTIPKFNQISKQHQQYDFISVLKQPLVIALFSVCFLVQASHGAYYTFYSIYLKNNNYSDHFIGVVWAIGVFAEVLLYLFMYRLIQRFSLYVLFLCSLCLTVIRWSMIAFCVNYPVLLIMAQLLHAASFGLHHAVAIQYVHNNFKGTLQGRGQAFYSSISFGAGLAFGTFLTGFTWSYFGATISYLCSSFMGVLAILIAWRRLK